MLNHAKMAKENGFPAQDIFIVEDGMPVDFGGNLQEPEARITQEVCSGLVCVDGTGVGDIDQDVLEDRQLLSIMASSFVLLPSIDKAWFKALPWSPPRVSFERMISRKSLKGPAASRQKRSKACTATSPIPILKPSRYAIPFDVFLKQDSVVNPWFLRW